MHKENKFNDRLSPVRFFVCENPEVHSKVICKKFKVKKMAAAAVKAHYTMGTYNR
jgi:hypothetical protein